MKKLLLFLLFLLPFITVAQEVYHIKFISKDVNYSVGVILYDDETGIMRVRYDAGEGEKLFEMTVKLRDLTDGFVIDGSNPRNVLTGSNTGYSADHFYVRVNDDGEIICSNSDDQSSNSKCCIMEVTGNHNQNVFLEEFGWSFD